MKTCLHCGTEYQPDPLLIVGCCSTCSGRHEEIATIGFSVTIAEARKILAGTLPGRVRGELQEMVRFYDES